MREKITCTLENSERARKRERDVKRVFRKSLERGWSWERVWERREQSYAEQKLEDKKQVCYDN